MSAASHAPGRLSVSEIGVGFEIESDDGQVIAQAQQIRSVNSVAGIQVRQENARRLAACWNACDGIKTDVLEKGRLSADAFQLEESRADRAEQQCDELLGMLKLLTEKGTKQATSLGWNARLRMARELIAKMEGGAQ